jgi:hypothetical protein
MVAEESAAVVVAMVGVVGVGVDETQAQREK